MRCREIANARNLHMEVHKVLHLQRNLHMKVHKVLHLPRKSSHGGSQSSLRMEVHKVLHLPRNLHMEVHKVLQLLLFFCTGRSAVCAERHKSPSR